MDFPPYRKDSYTTDEVAEIASRVAFIVGYLSDMEAAERGINDSYSRID